MTRSRLFEFNPGNQEQDLRYYDRHVQERLAGSKEVTISQASHTPILCENCQTQTK